MRIEQITFTRFLAAISIVIFHYGLSIFPFKDETLSFLFKHANIGVSYFFILSGFVMMIAYGQKTHLPALEYFKNRFARIYPVYFLAIFLILLYIFLFFENKNYYGIILNTLLLQAWIPPHALSFNPLGWTLSVEMFFYALFPFLYNHLYSKVSYKKIIAGIITFFVLSQVTFHILLHSHLYQGYPSSFHNFIFYFPLMHLSEFLVGNLAGIFFFEHLSHKQKNYDLWIVLCVLIFFVCLKYSFNFNFHNGLLSVIFVPLILLLSINTGVFTRILKNKFCIFLGEISYGIYILQIPVFWWTKGFLKYIQIEEPTFVFYTSLCILIGSAATSYLFIETPLRNFIKNYKRHPV